MSAQITAVAATDLFTGTPAAPRQVLRVTIDPGGRDALVTLRVRGEQVSGGIDASVSGPGRTVIEVPVAVDAEPGTQVAAVVSTGTNQHPVTFTAAEPGWTVHMVSHFHYDPVWWNTQAAYTSDFALLAGDSTTRPVYEHNGFALVDAHLNLALSDPDYRFILAEIDYLKPYFDTHPQRRADLRRLLAEGRAELVGGTYNEPNTNLTGLETTIRNIVYGVGYQRDILGGDPQTAWQVDAFGHDPQFPGLLAAAGLSGSAWARGPFHQWGPMLDTWNRRKPQPEAMQFASEFDWISPSGDSVLTHYMPHHYGGAYWIDSATTVEEAEQAVYRLYQLLRPVAATRNILLPVGNDYSPPNKWVTDLHRSWASKYVWPRFVCAIPRDFLDAVRAEHTARGTRPSPQSRDMNPVYTGKDVSYIDTKQAQRAGEVTATQAEVMATLAGLLGLGRYPHAALDKTWRHLAYGSHHDAITGSESDQVYIDLLAGWREAHDLAAAVRDTALEALSTAIDTSGDGMAVVVTNTLPFDRTGIAELPLSGLGVAGLFDDTGGPVPYQVDGGMLRFLATGVPATGWRTWRLHPGSTPAGYTWTVLDAMLPTIANEHLTVIADPARGGGLTSIVDHATGRQLLAGGAVGNELRVYDEYPDHPTFGEGPWHLLPRGAVTGSADTAAQVTVTTGPLGQRLTVTGAVAGFSFEQTITLWHGVDHLDLHTRILDYADTDKLIRVRFPCDLPGTRPVCDTAGAVIGRGFALPDVDAAHAPWTLDNPANTWFALSSTARIDLTAADGTPAGTHPVGTVEIVAADTDAAAAARDLVVALARVGVTATTATAGGARYGWLTVDSNLPDLRIVLGGPDTNTFAREVLDRAESAHHTHLEQQLAHAGTARLFIPAAQPLPEVWQPNADLRDARALPVLLIATATPHRLAGAVADLSAQASTARIQASIAAGRVDQFTDHTTAVISHGLPGFAIDPTGALHLSLMRSCTGWPSGIWIDPPRRTAPDGSAFQVQHWTHDFAYALATGAGDWRARQLPARGQDYITPLLTRLAAPTDGTLPARQSWLRVEPERDVLVTAVKPAGNPIATGAAIYAEPGNGVTVRLTEATGLGVTATVSGALTWQEAHHADLLEHPTGMIAKDSAIVLDLAGSHIATLRLTPAPATTAGAVLGPTGEVATPVFGRYWLHNRGPAPMGYLPIAVSAAPQVIDLDPDGHAHIQVNLASQWTDTSHEGILDIRTPDGWSATPTQRVFRLPPGGGLTVPVAVHAPPGMTAGRYFIAAQTTVDGTVFEDVVTVTVGDTATESPAHRPTEPVGDPTRGTTTTATPRPSGLTAEVHSTGITAAPGERTRLAVTLTNATRGQIRGEAQLISPWGTWPLLPETTLGFRVDAGERVQLSYPVVIPDGTAALQSWIMVKVMWFGRVWYSPAIALTVGASR